MTRTHKIILTVVLAIVVLGSVVLLVRNLRSSNVSITTVPAETIQVATSSAVVSVATTTTKQPVSVPRKPPAPPPTSAPPSPPPAPESGSTGPTTIVVESIPLLAGGTVHSGASVPVMYLQVTNIGEEGAQLSGFWIRQDGSAPIEVLLGLSTVDDRGIPRGSTNDGTISLKDGLVFVPAKAYFAPGQLRLFTIKAAIRSSIGNYIGMQLNINVASLDTTATVAGQFPIIGTIWTIAQ